VKRLALPMGAALAIAAAVPALAALPTNYRVVPVYTKPPAIRLSWTESGGTRNYNIFRSTDGGPQTQLGTIPGGAAGHHVSHVDSSIVPTTRYTYSVQVCDLTGACSFLPDKSTSANVVWPIVGGREVMHGYNEVIGWAAPDAGFHMGLDMGKTTGDGLPGDIVVAPRGGIVVLPNLSISENGSIAVQVDVGGGKVEYDSFNHIGTGANGPPVAAGDVVEPGQPVAKIGLQTGFPGNFTKHVHFMVEHIPVSPGQQRALRHPLLIFTDPVDRDPLGNAPALTDENKDGKLVLFRAHDTGSVVNYDYANAPLRGDVDVEPEVVDEQGTDPSQAPIDLGYWIEGPLPDSEQIDDVKSAAKPYRLYDFRVEFFGGVPGGAGIPAVPAVLCDNISDIADQANSGCQGLTECLTQPPGACNSVIMEGSTDFPWPTLHHFIVTHAKGETGARADVDRNQFWRTTAKDDGVAASSTHANYADRATTIKAWEARFPDGDYTIHAVASDLVHDKVDLPIRDDGSPQASHPGIRLENFTPFVKEIVVAQDVDGNPATGEPGLDGCEVVVRRYRHTHRQPPLRPQDVLISKRETTVVRAGQKLCTRIRFSEPMSSVTVDLARDRGTGAVIAGTAFTGTSSKTHGADDTWTGALTLPLVADGSADGGTTSDERDVALHIVALDRRDGGGARRGLDADGDGAMEPNGDVTHVIGRLDLSTPTGLVSVVKP
jgi:hypothetical protein